jgi:hypothetical protein
MPLMISQLQSLNKHSPVENPSGAKFPVGQNRADLATPIACYRATIESRKEDFAKRFPKVACGTLTAVPAKSVAYNFCVKQALAI